MPINSPPNSNNDYSDLLKAISGLTLTGGGGTGFKYVKSAEITLPANEESIILGNASDVLREVYLINNSDINVALFWNDGITVTTIPEGLKPNGGIFQDWSDGGLELRAFSSNEAQLKILVRDTKPINYQVGIVNNNNEEDDEMPINLLINKGLIINGGQLFYADSFRDGHEYNFIFSTNGSSINNNLKIYLFPLTFLSIPQMTFYAQMDAWGNYSNPSVPWQLDGAWEYNKLEMLANSKVLNISTSDLEIPFSLSFLRSKFIIGFGALISIPGVGEDEQIFNNVDYVPNPDPTAGGTFVLNSIFS